MQSVSPIRSPIIQPTEQTCIPEVSHSLLGTLISLKKTVVIFKIRISVRTVLLIFYLIK